MSTLDLKVPAVALSRKVGTGGRRPPARYERRLTVVHVASGDLWAGAEVQLYNLACALAQNTRVRLLVVLFNEGLLAARLRARNIEVVVFDETRLNSAVILRETIRLFRCCRPDIVHTHRQKENVIGSIAARLAGARSVRTVHGLDEFPDQRWRPVRALQQLAEWACARLLQARTVAVSSDLGEKLRRRQPAIRVEVVENGIDVGRVREAAKEPVTLPGPSGAVRIAVVSRLVPVKRIDIFLATAKLLADEFGPLFHFYVFGDGPLRPELEARTFDDQLNESVSFMGFQRNMAPYLKRMHMLFITSDHEGLPMNLLEALALEVPVVAHAIGGIPRMLRNGRCGTLVPSQDPQAYADAARHYVRDNSRFLRCARQGSTVVLTRHSDTVNAMAYKRLYDAVVNEDARGAPL